MILSRREKLIVWLSLGIIIITLGDWLLVTPGIKKWQTFSRRLEQVNNSLTRGQIIISREEDIKKGWQNLMETPTILTEGKDLLAASSKYLSGLAKKAGVNFSETNVIRQNETDEYTELILSIKFATPIGGLSKFLYQLDISPEFIRLLDLKILSSPEEEEDLKIEIRLSTMVIKKA